MLYVYSHQQNDPAGVVKHAWESWIKAKAKSLRLGKSPRSAAASFARCVTKETAHFNQMKYPRLQPLYQPLPSAPSFAFHPMSST